MGPGTDGPDHLIRFGGGENEHDVLRRLLHDFQQGVEPLLGDHMGLVKDEDLVPVPGGGEAGSIPQFAGVFHAVMAGGVHFDHINGTGAVGGQIATAVAFAARMAGRAFDAVHATGEDAGGAGLSAPPRTGEKIGMGQLALIQSPLQGDGDLFLSDDPVEGVRTITSIECKCHSPRLSIS